MKEKSFRWRPTSQWRLAWNNQVASWCTARQIVLNFSCSWAVCAIDFISALVSYRVVLIRSAFSTCNLRSSWLASSKSRKHEKHRPLLKVFIDKTVSSFLQKWNQRRSFDTSSSTLIGRFLPNNFGNSSNWATIVRAHSNVNAPIDVWLLIQKCLN